MYFPSQNHRMVGDGRDFCGSSSPTPLPKQGHLQQAAQHHVQAGLEYLQRRRLHNLPGQPGPVLRHPQSEEVLPHVQLALPLLQFVPVAPCPHGPHNHSARCCQAGTYWCPVNSSLGHIGPYICSNLWRFSRLAFYFSHTSCMCVAPWGGQVPAILVQRRRTEATRDEDVRRSPSGALAFLNPTV